MASMGIHFEKISLGGMISLDQQGQMVRMEKRNPLAYKEAFHYKHYELGTSEKNGLIHSRTRWLEQYNHSLYLTRVFLKAESIAILSGVLPQKSHQGGWGSTG
jgi:hypothetical protein